MRQSMKVLGGLVLLSFLTTLVGCIGANPFCLDPCPEGEIRDSFCKCMKRLGAPTAPAPSGPGNQPQFYMIARYSCVYASDPSKSAGDCTINQPGPSCQAAKDALLQDVASRGDVCVHCTNIVDPTKKWDGNPPQWIQGGPCWGVSMLPGTSPEHLPPDSTVAEGLSSAFPPIFTAHGPVDPMSSGNAVGCCCEKSDESCYQEQRSFCKGNFWDSGPCGHTQKPQSSLLPDKLPSDSSAELAPSPASHRELRFVAFSTSSETESCFAHCPKGVSNADCAAGKIDKSRSDSIEQLRIWVLSSNKSDIQPKDLMELFHVATADPCHRGVTKISTAGVANEGDACTVEAPLEKLDVRAQIHVPEKVEAKWDASSPRTKLRFTGSKIPTVHFFKTDTDKDDLDPMDFDFGGDIVWIETAPHRFMARTSKQSCVGIDY
jgi:hypothetical protein